MNEHQLKSEAYSLVMHRLKAKRDADYIRDSVMRMAKAYAAARVAAKDAEIAQLKAEVDKRGGCIIDMSQERARLDSENKTMKAENERMREGVRAIHKCQQRLDGFELRHLALESLDIGGMLRTLIESFELSPAPVTECVGKLAYCIKWCESLQYDSNRIATIKHRMEVHSNGVPGDDWWIFIDGMPKFHIWRGDKCHFEYVYAIIGDIIKNSPKTEIKR